MVACLLSTIRLTGADDKPGEEERAVRVAKMRHTAEQFQVSTTVSEESKRIPLHSSPLFRFSDPTREFHDATLWAFGNAGRPACLLTIEQYAGSSHFELISLTDAPVKAIYKDREWAPQSGGVTLQRFPNSPRPHKTMPLRLAQMKELLGTLSAHELTVAGKRFELRLLPTPIHRYSSTKEQLQDGGIFVFANGTNPELLAVIEARGEDVELADWQIGFARCAGAELFVSQNDKQLFHVPHTGGGRTDPYWIFRERDQNE